MSYTCGTGLWNPIQLINPDLNASAFTVTGTVGGNKLSWTLNDSSLPSVSHTQIFRGGDNVLSNALPLAQIKGTYYFDDVMSGDVGVTYYYWIQHSDSQGQKGNLIGPRSGTTTSPVQAILADLGGKIDSSHLIQSLKDDIAYISTVASDLSQEILDRTGANDLIAQTLAQIQTDVNGVGILIQDEITVRQTENSAMLTSINSLTAAVGGDFATYIDQINVLVENGHSYVATIEALAGGVESADGKIINIQNLDITPTSVIGSKLETIQTSIDTTSATVTDIVNLTVDPGSALAQKVSELTTSVDGNTATLTTYGSTLDGIQADWGVLTDVDGRVAGIKLINGQSTSDFTVIADTFHILNPATMNPIMQVDTQTQKVCFTGEVCFGSVLQDALSGSTGGIPGADGQITEGINETQFSQPYCALLQLGNVVPGSFVGRYAGYTQYNKGDIVWVSHPVHDRNDNFMYYYSNAYVIARTHNTASFDSYDNRTAEGYVKNLPPSLNTLADSSFDSDEIPLADPTFRSIHDGLPNPGSNGGHPGTGSNGYRDFEFNVGELNLFEELYTESEGVALVPLGTPFRCIRKVYLFSTVDVGVPPVGSLVGHSTNDQYSCFYEVSPEAQALGLSFIPALYSTTVYCYTRVVTSDGKYPQEQFWTALGNIAGSLEFSNLSITQGDKNVFDWYQWVITEPLNIDPENSPFYFRINGGPPVRNRYDDNSNHPDIRAYPAIIGGVTYKSPPSLLSLNGVQET